MRLIAIAEARSTTVHRRRQIENTHRNNCNNWDVALYIDTSVLFWALHFLVGSKALELTGAGFSRRTINNKFVVRYLQTYRKKNIRKEHSSAIWFEANSKRPVNIIRWIDCSVNTTMHFWLSEWYDLYWVKSENNTRPLNAIGFQPLRIFYLRCAWKWQ